MNYPTSTLYASGCTYPLNATLINDLRSSTFSTVILWALHVDAVGNLYFNDQRIVSGGQYVGLPMWPNQIAQLGYPLSGVERVFFSVGGWGVGDFANIQALIRSQGIGPASSLYVNFQALKTAIPNLVGIDLDDESLYDQTTTVEFSKLLASLNYAVTYCPYDNMSFWTACLKAANAAVPGCVSGFNLQCYAGGAGNDPAAWIAAVASAMGPSFPAAAFVTPGLWCRNGPGCASGNCPSDVQTRFRIWLPDGLQSGFIWLYDDILNCASSNVCSNGGGTAQYSAAIVNGLGGNNPNG